MSASPSTTRKRKRVPEPTAGHNVGTPNGNSSTPSISTADDEPPLSHAARRKQKKQAKRVSLQQATAEADSDAPKKKRKLTDEGAASVTKDASSNKDAKRRNSIWVGNMSFKTTEENLRAFFTDRGLGEISRVNMPTKPARGPTLKPENRGFAYVDFSTPEDKQMAIALSEQPLLGRKLLIKDGDDFTGRPTQPSAGTSITVEGVKKTLSKMAQKILRDQKQPPAPTLFFGNLSFETTEDSIMELLDAHRPGKGKRNESTEDQEGIKEEHWIRKVRMGTFEDSGKCKGFAFVDFSSIENATSALITPKNHHLNGRDLVVEYASPDAVRRGAHKGQKHKPQSDPGERKTKATRASQNQKPKLANTLAAEDPVQIETTTSDSFKPNSPLTSRKPEGDQRGNRSKGRGHQKPGAVLALAKRESTAIVPSQGKKITF